jgi:hypothetical protein
VPDAVAVVHEEALRMAFSFAKAERIGELNGSRVKAFDGRGLHPYSVEWGRILACEALYPDLAQSRFPEGEEALDMVTMRRRAHAEAYEEWVRERVETALAEAQLSITKGVRRDT